ncbi:MAG: MBL fold metallo-hydrolase [Bdellovibrionales bacterium]|nr:MBL fold metallo-hydrolase [Bdellovibrionales bacterium]
MNMKINLWGIRGSLPAPLAPAQIEERVFQILKLFLVYQSKGGISVEDFLNQLPTHQFGGFGGQTACVQVMTDKVSLIVDAGSGIRKLGEQLMLGPCGLGRGVVHILFSHFHWDHLIGLPFFLPMFVPGNEIHFYAVQEDLEKNVALLFQKPNFPVPFDQLGAKITFHKLEPRQEKIFTDIAVTPYLLDHPDPCWGFKFTHKNKVFSYCVDTECTRMSRKDMGLDLPLYQGVDLMLFDAQYSFLEVTERINWGHSTAPIGLDLAFRENIKKIYFVHHDPAASDSKIAKIEQQTQDYLTAMACAAQTKGESLPKIEWGFAREGMTLQI